MPNFVSLDFETRSACDLKTTGAYVYADDPTTNVICACYRLPGATDIHVWRPGDDAPVQLFDALTTGSYLRAWNAAFERVIWNRTCTRRYGWPVLAMDRFVCSMALARAAGLPGKLESAAQALGVAEQKDMEGHRLMMQLSKPRRKPKGEPVLPYLWWDDGAKIRRLIAYCQQDVRTEDAVWAKLPPAMDKRERQIWLLDQHINDRGVAFDRPLIHAAHVMAEVETAKFDAEMYDVTDGLVPSTTSLPAMKAFTGYTILDKQAIDELLTTPGLVVDPTKRRVLELRQLAAKSSVKKLDAMIAAVGEDGRARGMLQYYGAATGRWAGRLIQPQNLPKGDIPHALLDDAIQLVHAGNAEGLGILYDNPLDAIASLLRSTLVASPGKVLDVADFSAIEARVIAWLAGQHDLIDLFASGGKVYETMASHIFGMPISKITKDSFERDIAKRVTLGCGFGMGVKKFIDTVKRQGGGDIPWEVGERGVETFRSLYSCIPGLWYAMEETATEVVTTGSTRWVLVPGTGGKLAFGLHNDWLRMRLPSGRALWYHRPRMVDREMPWSTPDRPVWKPSVQCDVMHATPYFWGPQDFYGGIWAENATQAVARDIMADALLRVNALKGFEPVLSVHDEGIVESEPDTSHEEFMTTFSAVPDWAKGCPIAAEGWRGTRYRK